MDLLDSKMTPDIRSRQARRLIRRKVAQQIHDEGA